MFKKVLKLINEISYVDYFPKQFQVFLNDYKDKDLTDLYVTFSNYKSDTLDKRINYDPQGKHEDPAGIFTFPAEYVINHPMDVKFGANRKYLTVIKNRVPNKTLVLQDIDEGKFVHYLSKMFPDNDTDWSIVYKNKVVNRGTRAGYMFYWIVTHGGMTPDSDRSSKVITPKQSNNLLVGAGIEVLSDRGDKDSWIIHPDEAEQTIFLTRSSFEVVNVYELRKEPSSGNIHSNSDEYLEEELVPKLFNMLQHSLGNKISYFKMKDRNKSHYFFNVGDIKGNLSLTYGASGYHREFTDANHVKISGSLRKGDGEEIPFDFQESDSFKHIVSELTNLLNRNLNYK